MNIVNRLTIRHMKENKRRTMVTIMGVIISVVMVTAVATLFVSFLDLMKRQEIANNGEWHVVYQSVNKEQLEAIKKDENTKAVMLSRDVGYALLQGGQNENKPYLFIREYNEQGFKRFPIQLLSGRLPKTADEVVLSEHIVTNGKVNYKIGDQLTLEVGERFSTDGSAKGKLDQSQFYNAQDGTILEELRNKSIKTYTVVGFIKRPSWEPAWSPGYTVLSYVNESMMGKFDQVNASVVVKKVDSSLYTHAKGLAYGNGISSVQFNNELLRYYGVTSNDRLSKMLLSLSIIITAIIIIGSVSLIYNAFAISVSERSRHLGMLASVGATKRQKRNSVFFEGAVIGLISIPVGILLGIGGMGITFLAINSIIHVALGMEEELKLTVTPMSIVMACGVSMLTIFISTYLPARKASRISAIDAIRQSADVKLTRKNVKTSKLVRKLFGFEAEIGLKNLKRNKRRYQATIFSLVISIVLFLSVSYFTAGLKKSLSLSQDNAGFDIQVSRDGIVTPDDERLFQSFEELEDVTEASVVKFSNAQTWIDKDSAGDEFQKKNYQDQFDNGKMLYVVNPFALDEKNLKEYAKKIGADYHLLTNPEKPAGIVIDMVQYRDFKSKKFVEAKVIHTKVGKSLDLSNMNSEKQEPLGKVKIAALTDEIPMGVTTSGLGNITLIVSEPVLEKIVHGHSDMDTYTSLYLKSENPMKTQEEIEKLKNPNMSVYNVYKNRQQGEQMVLLMSVFSYGFIALITLISIANIFNTISTSISLRKREFAMLKSVGMTPKGFNKMIHYESIFYGIKSLLYGIPVSIALMYSIYLAMMNEFNFGFSLPWLQILYCLAAVFVIVGSAMLYSGGKVKKENIIDALKQESI